MRGRGSDEVVMEASFGMAFHSREDGARSVSVRSNEMVPGWNRVAPPPSHATAYRSVTQSSSFGGERDSRTAVIDSRPSCIRHARPLKMWALRPDDEAPIDLRKTSALQRDRNAHEALPLHQLRPFVSKSYGGAQVTSGGGSALETAIRKLHSSNGRRQTSRDEDTRSRSIDEVPVTTQKPVSVSRSHSCPDLGGEDTKRDGYSTPHPPIPVGGAKKRKCFVPLLTCSPTELKEAEPEDEEDEEFQPPPRRSLYQLDERPPYLMHVYDYYQQLVQRLREHPSPIRCAPPPDPDEGVGKTKRPARALTGKHVKQGTGASISTLVTLRQKIQERQRARVEIRPQDTLPPRKKQRHTAAAKS